MVLKDAQVSKTTSESRGLHRKYGPIDCLSFTLIWATSIFMVVIFLAMFNRSERTVWVFPTSLATLFFLLYSAVYLFTLKKRFGKISFYPSKEINVHPGYVSFYPKTKRKIFFAVLLGLAVNYSAIFMIVISIFSLLHSQGDYAGLVKIYEMFFSIMFGMLFAAPLFVYYSSRVMARPVSLEKSFLICLAIPAVVLIVSGKHLGVEILSAVIAVIGVGNIMTLGNLASGGFVGASMNFLRLTFGSQDPLGVEIVDSFDEYAASARIQIDKSKDL